MGFDKLCTPLCGLTAIERSATALISGGIDRLVITTGTTSRAFLAGRHFSVPHMIVEGGVNRRDSVRSALAMAEGDIAVIHDAARCFVAPELVRACIESAMRYGSGVAATRATDTTLHEEKNGAVNVVPRERLWLMQTPQVFRLEEIRAAYIREDLESTDDATLYSAAGHTLHFVESSADNFKLTIPEDWTRAQRVCTRFGIGFDTHQLIKGRLLVLGGVRIPYEKGLLGHSDADVLVHAIIDALLGAAALGDIGRVFPDTDAQWEGADSLELLEKSVRLLRERGFQPATVDATIVAQAPKLAPYISDMRENLARKLDIEVGAVSVKATTTEGMNDEGRGLCISAQAIASLH